MYHHGNDPIPPKDMEPPQESRVLPQTPPKHNGKRKRSEIDTTEDSSASSGRSKRVSRPAKLRETSDGQRKFACPFYKAGVDRAQLSRSCLGHGWRQIHRVREHLQRSHIPEDFRNPSVCGRCLLGFKSQELLMEHQREEEQCLVKAPEAIVGKMSLEQAAKLQSTKRKPDLSDEEKWFEWFQIVAPTHDFERRRVTPYHGEATVPIPDSQSSLGLAQYRESLLLPLGVDKQYLLHSDLQSLGISDADLRQKLIRKIRDYQLEDLQQFDQRHLTPGSSNTRSDNTPNLGADLEHNFEPLNPGDDFGTNPGPAERTELGWESWTFRGNF
ncbi:serine threonine kinase [Fusarium albosuccineum]|uniref:Serine threonine kinase n=1 Tax=Fusarium albosuccineum TaxID=1237068 RepID=A0A8H4KW66_9HYPO|nr:serine threonine kinase [Fusarium albosuccineum]